MITIRATSSDSSPTTRSRRSSGTIPHRPLWGVQHGRLHTPRLTVLVDPSLPLKQPTHDGSSVQQAINPDDRDIPSRQLVYVCSTACSL
ncbi:hypothetical protein, partial [Streptantibioticus ferralitis]